MERKLFWLWLSLQFGVGSPIYRTLYEYFGSIEAIYDCDDNDASLIPFLNPSQKRKLLDKNLDHATQVKEWCDTRKVEILCFDDERYPEPLRALSNYPAILYTFGNLPDFTSCFAVSIVGSRNMSVYGQKVAYEFGYALTKAGAIVVSGMARGIDGTAQKGALYAGGNTVAVLGCGIDVVYPRENYELYKKICTLGTVLTEFPPQTPPTGTNFPVRNRLISALSCATLVVEAGRDSGSLITANYAMRQGKDVYAIPGPINSFYSEGTNMLIRSGATLVTSPMELVEQYMDVYPEMINLSGAKMRPNLSGVNSFEEKVENFYNEYGGTVDFVEETLQKNTSSRKHDKEEMPKEKFDSSVLDETQKKIYDALDYEKPMHVDEIKIEGLSIGELSAGITMLELLQAVEHKPGGFYIKK